MLRLLAETVGHGTLNVQRSLNVCTDVRCHSEFRSCVNESGGGRPGLPVPNSPYGLCERKVTSDLSDVIVIELKVLPF